MVTAREIALDSCERGWSPIPIPFRKKGPVLNNWPNLRVTKKNVDKFFDDKEQNIGVLLGEPSRGLVDVDLDSPESRRLAQHILPKTEAKFGRKGSPKSHFLYYCPGIKTKSFSVGVKGKGKTKLVEMHSTGRQTVFPGSFHEGTGEAIEWDVDGDPAQVDAKRLKWCVQVLAAASLLVRFWPDEGGRNDAGLALAGGLLRLGWEEEKVARFIKIVAREAGDEEWEARGKTVAPTKEKLDSDQEVTGLPSLDQIIGGEVVKKIQEWLGLNQQTQHSGTDTPFHQKLLAEMNNTYALIIVGDKTAILKESGNPDEPKKIEFLAISAFKSWFCNRFVPIGDDEMPLAHWWLQHTDRRQYEGLEFNPGKTKDGYYNLWEGFSVEPKKGDCSLFLEHLRANVCQGNEDHYNWVVGWFAQIFQNPDKKIGTSLVLRGKQGTGKTIIGKIIGSLLASHYRLVSDPRFVTGRFNSHLKECLLLHADEGFWAGDKAAEGKIKDLVTGDEHLIELKGKEPFKVKNFIRLFVTGNPEWVVPAGLEERRFAVFEMGEKHMQDLGYFAALCEQMENGGREALLYHLLHEVDLSKVNLRNIPKTDSLFEQKVASLNAEQGWLLDLLMRGVLPGDMSAMGTSPSPILFDSYIRHARRTGRGHKSIETKIGIFLKKYVKGIDKGPAIYFINNIEQECQTYHFPPLEDCRRMFEEMAQMENPWGNGPNNWLKDKREFVDDGGGDGGM